MALSVFALFKIGIGPSSSHTVGPMRAAERFLRELETLGLLERTGRVEVRLYGSLALTGKGHATDKAVILGLLGEVPDRVDPDRADALVAAARERRQLTLLGRHPVPFEETRDLLFLQRERLPDHSNGMRFTAFDAAGGRLHEAVYYSVGGGFVVDEAEMRADERPTANVSLPYPFRSADELLAICERTGLSIADLMLENEKAWRDEAEIRSGLLEIWRVMERSIERGCRTPGTLPGGLSVRRRAPAHYADLTSKPEAALRDPLTVVDWINLYALAVNEENAAGGRVVTAPTNGAAGVIPAVLTYYVRFVLGADDDRVVRFMLTAGAIGMLYKENASISAAEVGCQGEVGVACSMAAAALCAVLGGTDAQVENAAEIGMEHNLGLTCDPIGGLVQIPCIERNAVGAVKAVTAARLALHGDGRHTVSLDKVIKTMMETGADMKVKYKETSRGGLAVNIVEC